MVPYSAPNAAGYTLEAMLGVAPNGVSEPDFLGWEIKTHAAARGPVTLMTPEPRQGYYVTEGVAAFVLRYGHETRPGQQWYFTGRHVLSPTVSPGARTRLDIVGWDGARHLAEGGLIALFDESENLAAGWGFDTFLTHWKRKHQQACFVTYEKQTEAGETRYRFSGDLHLGSGTDFFHCLQALRDGYMYYDPGIKIDRTSSGWRSKKRSQFRVHSRNLSALYDTFETTNV